MEKVDITSFISIKHFYIKGITRSWGQPAFYKKFNVRVVAVCPGVTDTPLISEMNGRSLGDIYEENGKEFVGELTVQT